MIETALHDKIVADSRITSLVGTRVYVGSLPQGVSYPCICITEIGFPSLYGRRIAFPHYQFSCYAATYPASYQVSDALITVLDGFCGKLSTYGIENIVFTNRNRLFDEQVGVYNVPTEFKVKFKEV